MKRSIRTGISSLALLTFLVLVPPLDAEELSFDDLAGDGSSLHGLGRGEEPMATGDGNRPLVIAHRGLPALHPGNTLPSLQAAIDAGADGLEVDLCFTRDGRIVLWHDPAHSNLVASLRELGLEPGMAFRPWVPNLGSSYRRPVDELLLSELRQHYGYTRRGSEDGGWKANVASALSPILGSSERADYEIPTFDEALAWARTAPGLRKIFLDVKIPEEPSRLARRFARRARSVLERHAFADRVVFMCSSARVLDVLQEELADTGAAFTHDQEITSLKPKASDYSAVLAARRRNCSYASIGRPRTCLRPFQLYRSVIEADLARRGELRLIAWTLNDEDEIATLLELGVDGIVTDDPALCARLLAAKRP